MKKSKTLLKLSNDKDMTVKAATEVALGVEAVSSVCVPKKSHVVGIGSFYMPRPGVHAVKGHSIGTAEPASYHKHITHDIYAATTNHHVGNF